MEKNMTMFICVITIYITFWQHNKTTSGTLNGTPEWILLNVKKFIFRNTGANSKLPFVKKILISRLFVIDIAIYLN